MSDGPIPFLDLAGTPDEMGHEHGVRLADVISNLADVRLELLCRIFGRDAFAEVQAVSEQMGQAIKTVLPDVYQETYATALGAGIPYWQLIVAGAYSDVSDLLSRRLGRAAPIPNECTLTAMHTPDGEGIIGTWDTHASAIPSLILCRRRPLNGLTTLALSTAGWPMQQGITSGSIGFAVANMVATTADLTGLPYISALPSIASAATLTDAVERATTLPHASARYYLLCDEREHRSIEIVPNASASVDYTGRTCHTNHFTSPKLAEREGRSGELSSSHVRYELAVSYLSTLSELASPIMRIRALADRGVFQHGVDDQDRTGAVFALYPRTRTIYYSSISAIGAAELRDIHSMVI